MKIHSIEIEGLWSYRERQRIDITGLPLVVGVGENGTGKSALLVNALVVAFYGRFPTRTNEESITIGANLGTVSVEFELGDALYRIERSYPRSGSATGAVLVSEADGWRALTEKGLKEVNAYIVDMLGMNYETASMTWIAEQGQYGKFAGALPSERFRLLSGVFGLDTYGPRAAAAGAKAKAAEMSGTTLDGRIAELHAALERDMDETVTELGSLDDSALVAELASAAATLSNADQAVAALNAIDTDRDVMAARTALNHEAAARMNTQRSAEVSRDAATAALAAAHERAAASRETVEHRFVQTTSDARRQSAAAVQHAEATRAAAQATMVRITDAVSQQAPLQAAVSEHHSAIDTARIEMEPLTTKIAADTERRGELQAELSGLHVLLADTAARIESLRKSAAATCFTCGQHLSADDCAVLIDAQQQAIDGADNRTAFINTELAELSSSTADSESRLAAFADGLRNSEAAHLYAVEALNAAAILIASRPDIENVIDEATRAIALAEDEVQEAEKSAAAERASALDGITAVEARESGIAESAIAAAKADITASMAPSPAETALAAALAEAETARDVYAGEHAAKLAGLNSTRADAHATWQSFTGETARRTESAAARAAQEERLTKAEDDRAGAEREQLIYSTLHRAYSPAGIPAMVLAGVVDDLNEAMNSVLDRLSGGELHIELRASRDTAAGGTENKVTVYVETPTGVRAYESLSGGQKFRVDVAVRVGLTQALARGTGTPVQTLILDEGWGSLDEKGVLAMFDTLNRLSETTSVITVSHLAAIKDAFPVRVEVTSDGGSSHAEVTS